MKTIRVVLIQKKLGTRVLHSEAEEIRKYKPHFVCFPEYFFVNINLGNHEQTPHNFDRQMKRIEIFSRNFQSVVIGGTVPEMSNGDLYNTSFVFDKGKLLGYYRKQNLFHTEFENIKSGSEYKVFTAYGIRFGVLICADVFKMESFVEMKRMGAKLIFIPTFSPKKEETVEEKYKRDNQIYVQSARLSDAVIVKVCGVKSEFKEFLQARSLIANKKEIIYRVNPDEEEKEMIIKKEIIL